MAYDWFLALHILAAVIWVGGAATQQVFAIQAQRSNDPQRMANFAADSEWIGTHIYLPSSLVLLGAGITLVIIGHWGFTTLWVVLGILGFLFSVVTGAAFLGPESKRLKALIEERGPTDTQVAERIKRIFLISRIENIVLLLVVIDMAVKPGS